MNNPILVVGATGNVGREVVTQAVRKGYPVRAGTRDPNAYSGPGEAVAFDFDRPETFGTALDGVSALFLSVPPLDPLAREHVTPVVEKAKEVGVERIVFLSAMGVEMNPEAALFGAEQEVMTSGIPHTILRPTFFMQNFFPGYLHGQIQGMGSISLPAGDGKTSFIHARDIGGVAVAALTENGHDGQAYALTGGEALDHAEATALLSEASGKEIAYHPVSEEQFAGMMAEFGADRGSVQYMLALYGAVRAGYTAAVSPSVEEVMGRSPLSFREFAREVGSKL